MSEVLLKMKNEKGLTQCFNKSSRVSNGCSGADDLKLAVPFLEFKRIMCCARANATELSDSSNRCK